MQWEWGAGGQSGRCRGAKRKRTVTLEPAQVIPGRGQPGLCTSVPSAEGLKPVDLCSFVEEEKPAVSFSRRKEVCTILKTFSPKPLQRPMPPGGIRRPGWRPPRDSAPQQPLQAPPGPRPAWESPRTAPCLRPPPRSVQSSGGDTNPLPDPMPLPQLGTWCHMHREAQARNPGAVLTLGPRPIQSQPIASTSHAPRAHPSLRFKAGQNRHQHPRAHCTHPRPFSTLQPLGSFTTGSRSRAPG